jgi:SAM-dependent methyltransferase
VKEEQKMGTAEIQGDLWDQEPQNWTRLQEPMHKPLWEAMLDQSRVDLGTRFLDAGCGGGGASVLAAERGAQVSGIDAAEGLVALARERVFNGDFRVGDIEILPFEEDAFEVVFAANSIQYTTDRVATLREFVRVCTPEGRIVAGLFGPQEKVAFSVIQKAMRDALPTPPAGGGPYELSGPGKLEGLFEEAGLQVLESGEVDCPFRYPDMETFWKARVSAGPLQGAMRTVDKEVLKSAVYKAVDVFCRDDSSIPIQPNFFKYVVASC